MVQVAAAAEVVDLFAAKDIRVEVSVRVELIAVDLEPDRQSRKSHRVETA